MTFTISMGSLLFFGGIGLTAVSVILLVVTSVVFAAKRRATLEKISTMND